MEDKVYTLLEKMYSEFTKRFEEIETNIATIETKLSKANQSLARIEEEQGNKISALFDAREVQFDVNERICDTLNRVEGKLDKLSLKVARQEDSLRRVR